MGIGELEKKNKNIYVVCLSIEVIIHWGGNAVEREEGKKIGGFLGFFFFFSFFQYCVALTLLLSGSSLLSLLAEPRSRCLPIVWRKADKSTPPPAKNGA